MQNMSGGKSGSFLFPTSNKRFVLKSINEEERSLMVKILPEYTKRLLGSESSRLVKIFGLFTIIPDNLHIILMENILPDREQMVIFDLKGSHTNRKVNISSFPSPGMVLKDQNFLEIGIKIDLCGDKKFVNQLIEDFEMLSQHKIMDYSIIVGIPVNDLKQSNQIKMSPKIVIGIIDILQKYNFKKISEKSMKSILHNPKDISVADPETYLERIENFLSQVFIE